MKEVVGDKNDFDCLDGFDELSEENQIKVKEAVERGHVADEDWRGVSYSLLYFALVGCNC